MASSNTSDFHGDHNRGFQANQIHNSTVNVNGTNNDVETEFLRALPSDYRTQKDTNPGRIEGTCRWILEDERFLQWRDAAHSSLLHVLAGPGCGKSVLAKSLIDERLVARSRDVNILYFFFKEGIQRQNESTTALGSIMHQFFTRRSGPGVTKRALSSYRSFGSKLLDNFAELWDIVIESIQDLDCGEVVCVFDALDECQDNDRLHLMSSISTFITKTAQRDTSTLKFIVTSRSYPEIEFDDLLSTAQNNIIRFDGSTKSELIEQEINRVIAVKVPVTIPRVPHDIQQKIIEHLQSLKNRTYLWLHLILDHIKSNIAFRGTETKIKSLISQLPTSVDQAYDRMLGRSPDSALTETVLSLAVAAIRPFTLEELKLALELLQGNYTTLEEIELETNEQFEASLKSLTGLLLTVHQSRVYFIHETAREFLLSNLSNPGTALGGWKASINIKTAHSLLAKSCITLLCLADFDHDPTRKLYRVLCDTVPFVQYSAIYWTEHYRVDETELFPFLRSTAWKLCSHETAAYHSWVHMSGRSSHSMICFAETGLETIVRELIRLDPSNIDVQDQPRSGYREATGGALQAATRNNHENVVRILLAAGADVNIPKDGDGVTALRAAVYEGNESLARLRLENGASVNHRSSDKGVSLLMLASLKGDGNMVRLLLEYGPDIDSQNHLGWTALMQASKYGHVEIVRYLLDYGAAIDVRNLRGRTALHFATLNLHRRILRLLLEAGAAMHLHDNEGRTALSIAITKGYGTMASILLGEVEKRSEK